MSAQELFLHVKFLKENQWYILQWRSHTKRISSIVNPFILHRLKSYFNLNNFKLISFTIQQRSRPRATRWGSQGSCLLWHHLWNIQSFVKWASVIKSSKECHAYHQFPGLKETWNRYGYWTMRSITEEKFNQVRCVCEKTLSSQQDLNFLSFSVTTTHLK